MKKITGMILIATMLINLVACQTSGSSYFYYYTNTSCVELIKKETKLKTDSNEEIIKALIDCMGTKSSDKKECVIKPDYVTDPTVSISNDYCLLDFDSSYYQMDSYTEVLYRAAMVKEITQLKDIEYVEFNVDGEDLVKNNKKVGVMTASDFVDDANNGDDSIEWTNVTLYFATKSGDKLIRYNRTLSHSSNVSAEKLVIETLIKGPTQAGFYRTLPSDARVLSVSVIDGICYLNLSSEFVDEMVNVTSEIPIYSITNSLCSLEGIDAVRILVNGDSSISFRESISLDTEFEFNESLINE